MKTEVKEYPILFNAEMVQAILAGRKTQTRRVMKLKDTFKECIWCEGQGFEWVECGNELSGFDYRQPCRCKMPSCPYGHAVSNLWIRETWAVGKGYDETAPRDIPKQSYIKVWYLADGPKPEWVGRTRVSIHMPRYFSRINLENKGIGVEQIQEITKEDSISEGIKKPNREGFYDYLRKEYCRTWSVTSFESLWDSIHSNDGFNWQSNPFVWVVKFKLMKGNENGSND